MTERRFFEQWLKDEDVQREAENAIDRELTEEELQRLHEFTQDGSFYDSLSEKMNCAIYEAITELFNN